MYQPKDKTQFPPKSLRPFLDLNSDQSHSVHVRTMGQQWSHTKLINVVYNFGKKYLLLRVSHLSAQILQDVQEWAFPTVSFLHASMKHSFPASVWDLVARTTRRLLCDTGRDKTPLFVPILCQPSCASRLLNPLGARGNMQPPGLQQSRANSPSAAQCLFNDTAAKKAEISHEKKITHMEKLVQIIQERESSRIKCTLD